MTECDRRPRSATTFRGSVLIIVLITLLFATFALVLFTEKAGVDLLVASRDAGAQRLRREAYSALEVTLAVLEEFRAAGGALRSPVEGWGDPLDFAGWSPREGLTVEVAFDDESGKISLAHTDTATLVRLFEAWQFRQADAERLADVLLGWMKKDYVPTAVRAPDYDQGAYPYDSPARPLRSYSELAAIDYAREVFYDEAGRPNDLWRRFADVFSLYDFSQTNLNAARTDVLTALGAYEPSQQQKLGDFRTGAGAYAAQGPGVFKTTEDAAALLGTPAMPTGFGAEIRALRINVTVSEGRTQFRLSAVIAPPGGATVVQTTATSTRTPLSDANPATPAPAASGTAKKLNYPFTLLEIKENAAIPPVPAAEPQA